MAKEELQSTKDRPSEEPDGAAPLFSHDTLRYIAMLNSYGMSRQQLADLMECDVNRVNKALKRAA